MNLRTALYEHNNVLPDSSKSRFPSVGQFDENLGQHLIVIVFRGI